MPKGTKSARSAEPTADRKRIQVGLIITAETRAAIEAEAARSGRTLSQVAELLIEKALQYDRVIAAMNASLDEIRRRNIHAAMLREGYHPMQTPYGRAYLPPDMPLERSGFKSWAPGELEAFGTETVEVPSPEPLTLEQARQDRAREKEILGRLAALEAALAKKESEK
jgi:hypothetical protein